MSKNKNFITKHKAEMFDVVMPLLVSMYNEFKDLSKKSPESAVSKGKIAIVNRLLEKVRSILADQDSIQFLDLLNEDDMPQNSDVIISLSQYVASMNAFREKFYGWDGSEDTWFFKS